MPKPWPSRQSKGGTESPCHRPALALESFRPRSVIYCPVLLCESHPLATSTQLPPPASSLPRVHQVSQISSIPTCHSSTCNTPLAPPFPIPVKTGQVAPSRDSGLDHRTKQEPPSTSPFPPVCPRVPPLTAPLAACFPVCCGLLPAMSNLFLVTSPRPFLQVTISPRGYEVEQGRSRPRPLQLQNSRLYLFPLSVCFGGTRVFLSLSSLDSYSLVPSPPLSSTCWCNIGVTRAVRSLLPRHCPCHMLPRVRFSYLSFVARNWPTAC